MEKISKKIIYNLDYVIIFLLLSIDFILSSLFFKTVPVIIIIILILSLLISFLGYYIHETFLLKLSSFILCSTLFFIVIENSSNLLIIFAILALSIVSLDFFSNFISEKFALDKQINEKEEFAHFLERQKSKLYNEFILVLLSISISVPILYITPSIHYLSSIYTIPLLLTIILIIILLLIVKYFR